jgi:phosphonate transport system permease protein
MGATGAGCPQIVAFAVLPQVLPDLISFTLYRFETNNRAAAVLGLIGAGGIGYLMNTSFRTFQYIGGSSHCPSADSPGYGR